MKHLSISILLLAISFGGFAQIGVNTENIQSSIVFYIDPAKNNATTGTPTPAQTKEDIIVDNMGKVGIGTITPTVKLDIVTSGTPVTPIKQFSIRDGSQANKYVMTTDDTGTGSWEAYVPGTQKGIMSTGVNLPNTTTGYVNTTSKISLYPGDWVVFLTLNVLGSGASSADITWINFGFADSATLPSLTTSPDAFNIIGGTILNELNTSPGTTINGKIFISNNTSNLKDYYLLAGKVVRSSVAPIYTATFPAVGSLGSLYAFRVNTN